MHKFVPTFVSIACETDVSRNALQADGSVRGMTDANIEAGLPTVWVRVRRLPSNLPKYRLYLGTITWGGGHTHWYGRPCEREHARMNVHAHACTKHTRTRIAHAS
eukprot:6200714-Pleurochrysis_carterae.AAC.2